MSEASTVVEVIGADGERTHVRAENLKAAVNEGATLANPDEEIRVRKPGEEKYWSVKASDYLKGNVNFGGVDNAIAVSRDEVLEHRLDSEEERLDEERYGGWLGDLTAFSEGWGDFLSFGSTEALRRQLGVDKEFDEKVQGVNSNWHTAGTVFGVANSLFLPTKGGGTGALAKAGRALPTSLVSRAGAGLAGKAGSNVLLRGAVQGATEAALYNTAFTVTDAIANNKPLTAEAVLSAAGTGALFGGAIGTGGALLNRVVNKIDTKLAQRSLPGAAGTEGATALQKSIKEMVDHTDDLLARSTKQGGLFTTGAEAALHSEALAAQQVVRKMAGKTDDMVGAVSKMKPKDQAKFFEAFRDYQMKSARVAKAAGFADDAAKMMDPALAAKALSKATGKAKQGAVTALDAAAMAESMGITNFVPDNPVTNLMVQAVAMRSAGQAIGKGGQVLAGKAATGGLLGRTLGAADRLTGDITGRLAHAVGRLKDGTAKAALGLAKAVNKGRRAHVPAAVVLKRELFDAGPTKGGFDPKDLFRKRARELNAAASNPDRARVVVESRVANIAPIDGALASALVQKSMDRLKFLHSKLPKPNVENMFGAPRWEPSDDDVAKFARYVKASEDPIGILDSIADGALTPEAVETLQILYPETFAEFQRQILVNLDQIRERIPFDKRVQLSLMFDVPADEVMRPSFITAMQSNFAPPPPDQSVSQGARKANSITVGMEPTQAQRTQG